MSQKDDNPIEAVFPKFSQDNQHVGNQVRYEGKKFKTGDHQGHQVFVRTPSRKVVDRSL